MIHEVLLPRENKIYLWQITCLQMDVLACAVALQKKFSQKDLQNALAKKIGPARAKDVAKWVFNHKNTIEGLQASRINKFNGFFLTFMYLKIIPLKIKHNFQQYSGE